jgi:hypothetical protein
VAVYHLDIEEDYYDFELVGISSHEKDYRLAWAMNRKLNWKLSRRADIVLVQKYAESRHAQFRYVHPVEQTIITLIDNKTEDGFLLPELQQFDYVLKIDDAYKAADDAFYRKLRTVPFVLAVHVLDIARLKSKQNLIYEYR